MTRATIIIPTYHERDNIAPLLERIHAAVKGHDYRVLFVDDDSQDGTSELVAELSRKYPVDIMVRKDKRGLASAVVDGITQAQGETLVVMDADLQHPPEVLPALLKKVDEGFDMAIGSRYVPGGGCEGWGRLRRMISKGAIFIAHLLLPQTRKIKDPLSGLFAFKKKAIEGVDLRPLGYKIILEVLIEGRMKSVAEVPFKFVTRERGQSKLSAKQQVEFLKHTFSLMRRSGELARFVKFGLVGGSGIIVNEGLLWALTEFVGLPYTISSPIAVEASIISNFMLNDVFTFRDRRDRAGSGLIRFLKFNSVSLGGLVINVGTLWLLTTFLGVHYLVSNLAGIFLAFLWNFLLNSWWTWK